MKRKIHELNDLLHGLVKDAELPEEISNVSEASRQRIDAIVAEMNRTQQEPVSMPKPVYSKPPKRRKVLRTPEPVSHFSEEPSQNPVVRMHDRLLQDAMPQPDAERKPIQKTEKKLKNKSSKKRKKSDLSQKKMPSKKFHIEIKEDLPPDIPRDTTIADYIRQKQLEETLASVPPKTPEQLRKEKVRKKAMKIREQMKQQAESGQKELVSQDLQPVTEPEDEIPAWEDTLSELAEKTSADELQVFEDTEKLKMPVLSDMPEIPEVSPEDTDLLKITEELKEAISDESQPVSELSEELEQEKLEQQSGIFQKISGLVQNLFHRDAQKSDFTEEIKEETNHDSDAVMLQTETVTEILMIPEESDDMPELNFEQTVLLRTVKIPKQKEESVMESEMHQKKISAEKPVEHVSVIQPKIRKKVVVSKRVKKSKPQEVSL